MHGVVDIRPATDQVLTHATSWSAGWVDVVPSQWVLVVAGLALLRPFTIVVAIRLLARRFPDASVHELARAVRHSPWRGLGRWPDDTASEPRKMSADEGSRKETRKGAEGAVGGAGHRRRRDR